MLAIWCLAETVPGSHSAVFKFGGQVPRLKCPNPSKLNFELESETRLDPRVSEFQFRGKRQEPLKSELLRVDGLKGVKGVPFKRFEF